MNTIAAIILIAILVIVIVCLLFVIRNPVTNASNGTSSDGAIADGTVHRDHSANAMVLSCMDYRYIGPTIDYLYGRNNRNDFDYFVLAGASLGFNQSRSTATLNHAQVKTIEIPETTPNCCTSKLTGSPEKLACWSEACEEHICLAIELHNITEIIVIDHMDCGYYRAVYGDDVSTPDKEERLHKFNIHKFIQTLKNDPRYSEMSYTGLLLREEDDGIRFDIIFEEHED